MSEAKILLAEDDVYSARLINDFLTAYGYDIVCVRDGLTALEEVAKTKFDIALLDLRLPGKNGFLVAEHLRENPLNFSIPIIIISAFVDQHNKFRAYEAGANYFLSKPVNTKELLLIIQNLRKQQRQRAQDIQSNIVTLLEIQLGRKDHSQNVINHCKYFAEVQGIFNENINTLIIAAKFHDVGLLDAQNQEGHVELSTKIAKEIGLPKDAITLIKHHHHIAESDLAALSSGLIPLVKIIQLAEKIEEVYRCSPHEFQNDIKKGCIQPRFVEYITGYIE